MYSRTLSTIETGTLIGFVGSLVLPRFLPAPLRLPPCFLECVAMFQKEFYHLPAAILDAAILLGLL
jgi:hypothetical protein